MQEGPAGQAAAVQLGICQVLSAPVPFADGGSTAAVLLHRFGGLECIGRSAVAGSICTADPVQPDM